MKWKFRPNISLNIKRLLTILVITGILVIAGLSWQSLNSVNKLIQSQKRLTEIVMPMSSATGEVKTAVVDLTIRKYAFLEAEIATDLGKMVTDRELLEQKFKTVLARLKNLVKDINAHAGKKLNLLESLFSKTIEMDIRFEQSVKKRIHLENIISKHLQSIEILRKDLLKMARGISYSINSRIMENLYTTDTSEEDRDSAEMENAQARALTPGMLPVLINLHQSSESLRQHITVLSGLGKEMVLAENKNVLADIEVNRVLAITEEMESLFFVLKEENPVSGEISSQLKSLEKGVNQLLGILVEQMDSVSALKRQLLEEKAELKNKVIEFNKTSQKLNACLKELETISGNIRRNAVLGSENVSNFTVLVISIVGLLASLVLILTGFMTGRRIIIPIRKVSEFAVTIAQGDLTAEIEKEHKDEIGDLMDKLGEMASSLNALIGQVQRSGIQVTSSATELSATSKQQEAVMKTQLESTNYVVKSIGEISNVSEELVETMQKVAAMSEQTADFASSGQTDLSKMEEAMRHMENASKSISGKLEAISDKAANITSVVTTITKVADQTNLLSLNAAIEAEKAGEYGRGFTVVAREIRRLADQTAVATLDIDQMVQEMQSAVSAGVMEMDAFITEVQRSAENVGRISNQLSKIIEQVQALTPSFEEVNESMQFQSGNAQKINNSMLSLSEEMEQTVDSLRESFLAIEQLNDAARGLQEEVSRFKVG